MCSRYNLTSPPELVKAYFGLGRIDPFPPRYNIAPTQPVGIVRRGHKGERVFHLVRWGLIPGWAKDPARLSLLINARAETAAEKPAFRGALRHRRCLVPANGYYEWTGPAKARRPLLLSRPGDGLLAFGAIFEHWLGADGSELETMAILTVPSGPADASGHDRAPLIIEPDAFGRWLDCTPGETGPIDDLLKADDRPRLTARPVSPALNSARHEGRELLIADGGSGPDVD